jgi:hypothetical protein
MIQAIINEERRGDVTGDIVEFGHLRLCFFAITLFFVQMSPLFTATMFLQFVILLIFVLFFFMSLFNDFS